LTGSLCRDLPAVFSDRRKNDFEVGSWSAISMEREIVTGDGDPKRDTFCSGLVLRLSDNLPQGADDKGVSPGAMFAFQRLAC
jgi:hypothetical protein